jgi:hypothetical protein
MQKLLLVGGYLRDIRSMQVTPRSIVYLLLLAQLS